MKFLKLINNFFLILFNPHLLTNLPMFIPVLLNIGVSYLWMRVDKMEVLILHQMEKIYFPQIHIHNSNKLLYK